MLGDDVVSREVFCICLQAQGCQQSNEIEAAWNSRAHGPILSLVGGLSCHKSSTGSTDVTTARLNPKYKPATDLSHGPLPGKVIDFVFFLKPTNNTERAFGGLTWEPNHGRDSNHTLHGRIANRPIAISMETKREGEGQIMGWAQLSGTFQSTAGDGRLWSGWAAFSAPAAYARACMVSSPRPPRT